MYKTIKRYPDYEIDKMGNIRRKNSMRMLKHTLSNGHYKVGIGGNTEYVSRLVAETFMENTNGYSDVLHLNGDKKDNRLKNLKWATHSDTQRASYNRGCDAPGGYSKPVRVKVIETQKVYDSIKECAKDISGSPSGVRKCLNGVYKTHKGFHIEIEN